jgi:TonB-dependent starch-binding outer membrane protein SusC
VEIEFGFDAGLFNERVGLEVTYYDKTSKDLILSRPIAPRSASARTRWSTSGS